MMILLRQNQSNQFALTLSELADPNVASNWLFRFRKEQSKDSYGYLLFLTDETTNPERYNLFTLVEGTDVTFEFVGDYEYRVYQMPDTNDMDYNRGTLVELGKMRLIKQAEVIPTFTPSNEQTIYDQEYIS
jgi:hypothetical protein